MRDTRGFYSTMPAKWCGFRAFSSRPGPTTVRSGLAAGVFAPPSEGKTGVKLSTKGRYAVMAMVDLAAHSQGRPVALAEIADRQEISLSYLEQLFAKLRRGGLVKSVRGPGGGYLLAHTPPDTRISDIIIAVDEPIRATRCTPGSPAGCRSNRSRCLTHDLWEELGNQIYLYLSAVSLEDVCERRVLGSSRLFRDGTPVSANPGSGAPVSGASE